MTKKNTISISDEIIAKLNILAMEKENVRSKLAVVAEELRFKARQLAVTAKEKESVRRKLAITAKEKENIRRKLLITAKQLAVTAREKESVRNKLAISAEKLKSFYGTLEKKVFERTKDLEMARVKEEAILLSIGDGLLATDEKGKIILINRTAEKLLGKSSTEVIGKIFSETILIEDGKGSSIKLEKHPVRMALTNATTTTTTTTAGPVYFYVRKDNSKFPVAITVTPVILDGDVIGTIEVFRDITYEREIDKAKTEFVSLASHQLRTPLSTVNWYSEMLLAGTAGELNEKQKKYLEVLYRSNQRMVELVNALLDVSCLELGTFVIEPEATNIIELAQNVIDEQKPQIDSKKIRIKFTPERDIPIMQADPKLLRMVIQNILSNSVKYTEDGGKIDVYLKKDGRTGKSIHIRISDTGYGIPKNQQDKIFTKLFRADNVRNKDTDGTGLGLYIAKSNVENSGGKIWFKSRDTGEHTGTTFYVTLPIDGIKKT